MEQEQILERHNGNAMVFFRTCSKPDLNWFIGAVTTDLLTFIRVFEGSPSKETKGSMATCSLENLVVDTTTRTVSFMESKQSSKAYDNIFTALAVFLADMLAMALNNDHSEIPKQSRFRCKIAIIFAVEGIHERMRSALSNGGIYTHKVLWAQEVLKQNQRLKKKAAGALHVVKATTDIKQG